MPWAARERPVPRSGGRRAPRHARAEGADDRRRLPVRPAPQPVQGLQRRVRRVPAVHARRRSARRIDWKVYARSDRHYVKKFEEETNLDCHLMLDVSGSMGYGSHGHDQVRVRRVPRGVARLPDEPAARRRRADRVRRAASSTMLPASARPGHLRALLVTLDRLTTRPARPTSSKPLHQLADALTQARHGRADFRSARRSRASHPRPEALPVPRHRRDRVPRARSRRDRVPVRARDAVRGSRDRARR